MVRKRTTSHDRAHWFGRSALFAAIPLIHFAISVCIWLLWSSAYLWNSLLRPRFFEDIGRGYTYYAPAFCLLALSIAAYVLALKRRRAAWRLLLIVTLSAGAFFWTDVHFERYQVSIDVATQEYWDSGGHAHLYFTWWWYNDRWFSGRT